MINPARAVLETTNYVAATSQFAQAHFATYLVMPTWMILLSKRDDISNQIKSIVDKQTEPWGIDVEMVKLQNIELPQDMKRAMAKEAEASANVVPILLTPATAKSRPRRLWLRQLKFWLIQPVPLICVH